MIKTTQFVTESLQHTTISTASIGRYDVAQPTWEAELTVIDIDGGEVRAERRPSTSIDDLVEGWECDPETKAALIEARRWLSKVTPDADGETIRTLRLERGMTQRQLAAALETSQSHIARIENSSCDPLYSTMQRLADVLGIDMNTLDTAVRRKEAAAARSL